MTEWTGQYSFVSGDNFINYMKAWDVGAIQRNLIWSIMPNMIVDVNGDNFVLTTFSRVKTINTIFTLNQKCEVDLFGVGKAASYIVTQEDNNILVFRGINDPSSTIIMTSTEDGVVMKMTTKGVTATVTFKRI